MTTWIMLNVLKSSHGVDLQYIDALSFSSVRFLNCGCNECSCQCTLTFNFRVTHLVCPSICALGIKQWGVVLVQATLVRFLNNCALLYFLNCASQGLLEANAIAHLKYLQFEDCAYEQCVGLSNPLYSLAQWLCKKHSKTLELSSKSHQFKR